MDEFQIRDRVHDIIKKYLLTSKSKSLKHLNFSNEGKISKRIIGNNSKTFAELSSKYDQYNSRLLKLLHNSISDEEAAESNPIEEFHPQYIGNRQQARKYLEKCFLIEDKRKEAVLHLIQDDYRLQGDYKAKRLELFEAYKVLKDSVENPKSKLEKIYLRDKEKILEREKTLMEQKLDSLDRQMMADMRRNAGMNEITLRNLGVPFFCINSSYVYESLEADKKYLLDLLVQLIFP